jgi:ABC-type branched-subunit amino acid transport system permease subunit
MPSARSSRAGSCPATSAACGGGGRHPPGVSEFSRNLPGIHINFIVVLFRFAAFTALWGALLGFPTLRHARGHSSPS